MRSRTNWFFFPPLYSVVAKTVSFQSLRWHFCPCHRQKWRKHNLNVEKVFYFRYPVFAYPCPYPWWYVQRNISLNKSKVAVNVGSITRKDLSIWPKKWPVHKCKCSLKVRAIFRKMPICESYFYFLWWEWWSDKWGCASVVIAVTFGWFFFFNP